MTSTELAIEAAGWAGAMMILLAYLLLSAGKLGGQSIVYQGMNVVGAAGVPVDDPAHDGRHASPRRLVPDQPRLARDHAFAKISDALCPPKPIELESAVVMLRARAVFGT